jgi:hypothetical protein
MAAQYNIGPVQRRDVALNLSFENDCKTVDFDATASCRTAI